MNNEIAVIQDENKPRDYLFDNLKAILIFLVVFGHLIEVDGMHNKTNLYSTIWCAIYVFHMPLFIFITGYLTKYDIDNTKKAIKNYLIPYIVFNIILYVFEAYVLQQDVTCKFMKPKFATWFLLALFYYKMLYNGIYKIKRILIFSLVTAILVGFDTSFGKTGDFSRIACFLPFFIAGTKFKKEYLLKINSKKIRYILVFLTIILLLLFGYIVTITGVSKENFGFKKAYNSFEVPIVTSMLCRILLISFAFIFSYLILNVVPNEKTRISVIGQNTITVYLLHTLLIKVFKFFKLLSEPTFFTIIISMLISIVFTYITSRPIVKRCYDKIINGISNFIGI